MFNALFNQVVDKEWNRFSFALYFYMNMVKYYPIQFNVKLCVCVCVKQNNILILDINTCYI